MGLSENRAWHCNLLYPPSIFRYTLISSKKPSGKRANITNWNIAMFNRRVSLILWMSEASQMIKSCGFNQPPRCVGAPLSALRCGRWWVVVGPIMIPYHKIPSYNININNINILSYINKKYPIISILYPIISILYPRISILYFIISIFYINIVIWCPTISHHVPIIFPWLSHHGPRQQIRPEGPNEAQLRAARFTMSQHDSCLVGRWVDGSMGTTAVMGRCGLMVICFWIFFRIAKWESMGM